MDEVIRDVYDLMIGFDYSVKDEIDDVEMRRRIDEQIAGLPSIAIRMTEKRGGGTPAEVPWMRE